MSLARRNPSWGRPFSSTVERTSERIRAFGVQVSVSGEMNNRYVADRRLSPGPAGDKIHGLEVRRVRLIPRMRSASCRVNGSLEIWPGMVAPFAAALPDRYADSQVFYRLQRWPSNSIYIDCGSPLQPLVPCRGRRIGDDRDPIASRMRHTSSTRMMLSVEAEGSVTISVIHDKERSRSATSRSEFVGPRARAAVTAASQTARTARPRRRR